MKALLRSRFTWLSVLAIVALCAAVALAALIDEDTQVEDLFNHALYNHYIAYQVHGVNEIVEDYEWQQVMYLPIALPDPDFIHVQSGGILAFDPNAFPDDFLKGLIPVQEGAITMYPITVYEDPQNRERVILNARDEKIGGQYSPWSYDPQWFVKERYPNLSAMDSDYADWLTAMYDPSRIVITYKLILEDELIKYVWKQSIDAALKAEEEELGGGMMMMGWEGGSVTNIKFVAIEKTNDAICVTIAYPDDFTNALDIFTCDGGRGLLDFWWEHAVTTNIDSSTNWIAWTDLESTNAYVDIRFYVAANADVDSDGDGFTDGFEKYVYHTCTTNEDSHPVSVSGSISYTGSLTGPVRMIAVTESNSWVGCMATISSPGTYTNDKVANSTSYWFKAYRDCDSSKTKEYGEPWGIYSNTSTLVTNDLSGINITLEDRDEDDDGLIDWWEMQYFGDLDEGPGDDEPDNDALVNSNELACGTDPTNDDTDGDTATDGEEVQAGSDPLDAASFPVTVAGTTSYTGNQTGTVYVLAVTASDSWSQTWSTNSATAGPYTNNGIPNLTSYWFKAYSDADGDAAHDDWEPSGTYAGSPVYLTNDLNGIDIAIDDLTLVDLDGTDAGTGHAVPEESETLAGVMVMDEAENPDGTLIVRSCGVSNLTRVLSFSDYGAIKLDGATITNAVTVSSNSAYEVTYAITQNGEWDQTNAVTATLTVKDGATTVDADSLTLVAFKAAIEPAQDDAFLKAQEIRFQGTVLPPGLDGVTCAWSVVSGTCTPSSASSTNFDTTLSSEGTIKVRLEVTQGGVTVTNERTVTALVPEITEVNFQVDMALKSYLHYWEPGRYVSSATVAEWVRPLGQNEPITNNNAAFFRNTSTQGTADVTCKVKCGASTALSDSVAVQIKAEGTEDLDPVGAYLSGWTNTIYLNSGSPLRTTIHQYVNDFAYTWYYRAENLTNGWGDWTEMNANPTLHNLSVLHGPGCEGTPYQWTAMNACKLADGLSADATDKEIVDQIYFNLPNARASDSMCITSNDWAETNKLRYGVLGVDGIHEMYQAKGAMCGVWRHFFDNVAGMHDITIKMRSYVLLNDAAPSPEVNWYALVITNPGINCAEIDAFWARDFKDADLGVDPYPWPLYFGPDSPDDHISYHTDKPRYKFSAVSDGHAVDFLEVGTTNYMYDPSFGPFSPAGVVTNPFSFVPPLVPYPSPDSKTIGGENNTFRELYFNDTVTYLHGKIWYRYWQGSLNGGISDSNTVVTVDSTEHATPTGAIRIDEEIITYTATNATQFLNCMRGAYSTEGTNHLDNATVSFIAYENGDQPPTNFCARSWDVQTNRFNLIWFKPAYEFD